MRRENLKSTMTGETMNNCPICGNELEYVKQSYPQMLNQDQFDAIKAGDWYCRTDRVYWWETADSGLVRSPHKSRLNEDVV